MTGHLGWALRDEILNCIATNLLKGEDTDEPPRIFRAVAVAGCRFRPYA
jgi:hypothetical protein